MKKWLRLFAVSFMMLVMMCSTALAAGWTAGQDASQNRWRYDLGEGRYYSAKDSAVQWQWLDGNGDGTAECYGFDQEGWMYADTTTPDGYQVNADGAWIVGGIVQIKAVAPGYAGTEAKLPAEPDSDGKRILVAYFSHTGTTEAAAKEIQSVTGGDLFEIRTTNTYPSSYQATVDVARSELDSNARPELAARVDNMEQYDVILVGYPIWWHTTPMAVHTFLESYDLSGKTVLPFCTSGGSDVEESMAAVRASSGNANVGSGLTANSLERSEIENWLSSNGI